MTDPELPDTRPIGRGMVFLAWVIALGLLSLYFNDFLEDRENPNREVASRVTESGWVEVELKRNAAGHYVVSGRINGYPVTFLIDTGASDVAIPSRLAEEIGLERGAPVLYQTAKGMSTGYLTTIDRLEIGDIVLQNVRASISPDYDADQVLLGMSVLKRLEFAQVGNRLVLRQRRGAGQE